MRKGLDFFSVFIFFFVVSVMLLVTYSLSFYISDLFNLLKTPLKIVFIVIYSMVFAFYFACYIMYSVKTGRFVIFISGLLAMFYLHEYNRNIFLTPIRSFDPVLFAVVYAAAGSVSIALAIVADILQIKRYRSGNGKKKKHEKQSHPKEREYFV